MATQNDVGDLMREINSTQFEASPERRVDPDLWLTPLRFALFLGVLLIATFPKVIFGQETFFHRSYAHFDYSLAYHFRECFWRGEIPLWNPWNNCGLPYLAQWNTQTLYPFSLFYLIFPLSWALGVYALLHMLWGGLGMFYLARRRTGSRLAGALAGTVFCFNGLTWHSIMWPHNLCTMAWMPWTVLAVELAWQRGGRQIIVAALVGAVQFLSGTPEIVVFTWGILGVFWIVEVIKNAEPRRRLAVRFPLVFLLVTALSAAQLLPFVDLVA